MFTLFIMLSFNFLHLQDKMVVYVVEYLVNIVLHFQSILNVQYTFE